MRQIFGHAVDDTQTKLHTVGDSSSNKFEICAKSSIYHLEINLSDVGFKDARVVKSLLKDFTSTKPVLLCFTVLDFLIRVTVSVVDASIKYVSLFVFLSEFMVQH